MKNEIKKAGFYKADTINGVYYQDSYLDEPETEVLSQVDFRDSLGNLDDGEVLCAFFDVSTFDILDEIDKEYGVSF